MSSNMRITSKMIEIATGYAKQHHKFYKRAEEELSEIFGENWGKLNIDTSLHNCPKGYIKMVGFYNQELEKLEIPDFGLSWALYQELIDKIPSFDYSK